MKGKHAKNTANKQKLAKRMLALCFAVVFLCSCVLPVFATGSSLLTDALREAVEETAASTDTSTEAGGGTMMDDFQTMVSSSEYKTTYRFWLSEKDSDDLPDAAMTSASDLKQQYADFYAVAAIVNNTTLTAPEGFQNPTDPTDEGRTFEGWYYIDTYGLTQTFTFDDSPVLLDKSATIDVFAQWGEAPADDPADDADKAEGDTKADDETVSDDKTTPSDESSKNTESKANETETVEKSATVTDEYDPSVSYSVKVAGLPANTKKLSVSLSEVDDAFEDAVVENKLTPMMQFNITPMDAQNNTVQPNGAAKVSISGFSMEDTSVAVLHLTNGTVEILNGTVANGTLTFETTSFSPFVVAMAAEDAVNPVTITHNKEMTVGETITLTSDQTYSGYTHSWSSSDTSVAIVTGKSSTATLYGKKKGQATITHKISTWGNSYTLDTYNLEITEGPTSDGEWVYLYAQATGDTRGLVSHTTQDKQIWFTIGKIYVPGLENPGNSNQKFGLNNKNQHYVTDGTYWDKVIGVLGNGKTVDRWIGGNQSLNIDQSIVPHVDWKALGLTTDSGANMYADASINTWHLDGKINVTSLAQFTINYYILGTKTKIKDSVTDIVDVGTTVNAKDYYHEAIDYNGETYKFDHWSADAITVQKSGGNVINLYYTLPTAGFYIQKEVTGNIGDMEQEFPFTLTVTRANGTVLSNYTVTKGTNTSSAGSNGRVSFNLKHGEQVFVSGVPGNAIITIAETVHDYDVTARLNDDTNVIDNKTSSFTFKYLYKADSATTYTLDDSEEDFYEEDADAAVYATVGSTTPDGEISTGDTVTIINNLEMEVPTGVILDTLPYVLMLIAVGGGVVAFFLRKRHHDDEE